jgi:hypothetical protein
MHLGGGAPLIRCLWFLRLGKLWHILEGDCFALYSLFRRMSWGSLQARGTESSISAAVLRSWMKQILGLPCGLYILRAASSRLRFIQENILLAFSVSMTNLRQ